MRYTVTLMVDVTALDDAAAVEFARQMKLHVPDDVLRRLAAHGLPPHEAVTDVRVMSVHNLRERKEVLNAG